MNTHLTRLHWIPVCLLAACALLIARTRPQEVAPFDREAFEIVPAMAAQPVIAPAAALAGETCFATIGSSGQFSETLLPIPVQSAIDAAPAGGTVKLAGTCRGVNFVGGQWQTARINKQLTIEGGYTVTNWITPSATNVTVLDAASAGRVLLIDNAAGFVTLKNLTLQNGFTSTQPGGALFANAITVLDNVHVLSSTASGFSGGGAYFNTQALLSNVRFEGNTSAGTGGGAAFRDVATLSDVRFVGNSAALGGGGASFDSVGDLDRVRFERNSCAPCASQGGGGVWAKDTLTVKSSDFIANTSAGPGAALSYGAGAVTDASDSATIVNTLFARNGGTASHVIHVDSKGTLALKHNTIASPTVAGTAVHLVTGTVHATNTLIAKHQLGFFQSSGVFTSERLLHDQVASPINGSIQTNGTFSGRAGFANPAADDYRLTVSSDARDLGVGTNIGTDHDGEPRPLGSAPDIGYDELAPVVIHISVDGLGAAYLKPLLDAGSVPNFAKLRDQGASTLNARTDVTWTITLPNHTAMLSGRPVENGFGPNSGHRWTSNGDPTPAQTLHNNAGYYISSTFDVAHDHGFRTGLYASKTKFSIYTQSYTTGVGAADVTGANNGTRKIDNVTITEADSTAMMTQLLADLANPARRPNYAFVHFNDPDAAGHASNWGSQAYTNAVISIDGKLGQLLAAIAASPVLSGNTSIVLSADHGGGVASGGGQNSHDVNTAPINYTIPFFVWGPNLPPGMELYQLNGITTTYPGADRPMFGAAGQPIRNGDGGNCALHRLGLPAIAGSPLDHLQNACQFIPVPPTVLIRPHATGWRYKDDGSNQGGAWRAPGFDDSGWLSGAAPLGYGDPVSTTINSGPAGDKFITSYFRKKFTQIGSNLHPALTLKMRRDDGAIAYLNGTTIARSNVPAGSVGYRTQAISSTPDEETYFVYSVPITLLVDGANVLAIEVHQANPTSSDVYLDAELIGAPSSTIAGVRIDGPVEQNPLTTTKRVFMPLVQDVPCTVVAATPALGLDPFYKKHCDVGGLPVVSSAATPDRALVAAADVIRKMLAKRPDVLKTLADGPTRVGILAASEVITSMPEYRNLYSQFPGTDWNTRARGLGATPFIPLSSSDEANTLCYAGDPWIGESIMVHEFAHTIKLMGLEVMTPTFAGQVQSAFSSALAAGKWGDTYAGSNVEEYWAEGVQDYFNTNLESIPSNGIHNQINTRAELQTYDPALYALIDGAFAGNPWSYRCP